MLKSSFKLLSTKIYWDKPTKRDEYKAFWKKYQEIEKTKETNKEEFKMNYLQDEYTNRIIKVHCIEYNVK